MNKNLKKEVYPEIMKIKMKIKKKGRE